MIKKERVYNWNREMIIKMRKMKINHLETAKIVKKGRRTRTRIKNKKYLKREKKRIKKINKKVFLEIK